jgi:hypothetical protein
LDLDFKIKKNNMFKIKTPLEILEEIKQRRLKKNKEVVK